MDELAYTLRTSVALVDTASSHFSVASMHLESAAQELSNTRQDLASDIENFKMLVEQLRRQFGGNKGTRYHPAGAGEERLSSLAGRIASPD